MRTLAPLLALSILAACETAEPLAPTAGDEAAPIVSESHPLFPSTIPYSGTTRSFEEERATADLLVTALSARVEQNESVWIYREQLAGALLSRARLTGHWDDYAAAEEQLDQALLQPNAAPWGTLAALRYTMHQFDELPSLIERIGGRFPASDYRAADVALKTGNLDLQQGRYESSRASLEQAVALHDSPSALSSLAVWHWRTADFEAAEQLFVQASQGYHAPAAEPRAWFHLNLGLLDLDRGRWKEALAHYRDAERELSGSWLVEEHIAEVLVLLGETERAEVMYRDVIERTDAPEFMDALSGLLAERGDAEEAAHWLAEARDRWDALLVRFPEAAYGHALGHYLDSGDAPERALQIAQTNHDLRPDGEAKMLLAQALLALDRAEQALVFIEEALASAYESADLHVTAAAIYEATGDSELAQQHRDSGTALNPHALD